MHVTDVMALMDVMSRVAYKHSARAVDSPRIVGDGRGLVNTRRCSAELTPFDRQLRIVIAEGVWYAPRVAGRIRRGLGDESGGLDRLPLPIPAMPLCPVAPPPYRFGGAPGHDGS